MEKTYVITGIVLGKLWGGGKVSYPSRKLSGDNLSKLIVEANEMLQSGELDSGMGYELLIGAYLCIETISTIVQDGKNFHNVEYTYQFIGNLTDKEKEFLELLNSD